MKELNAERHRLEEHDAILAQGHASRVKYVDMHVTNRRGETTRKVRMVVRQSLEDPLSIRKYGETPERIRRELEMHEHLRGLGIPVLPTLRLDPETQQLYSTDLTNNGKNAVFSPTNHNPEVNALLSQMHGPPLAVPNADHLLDDLVRIARSCAEAGIRMRHGDALYFVMDKRTRQTRVIVGDYKHLLQRDLPPADSTEWDDAGDTREECIDELFRANLSTVRTGLSQHNAALLGLDEEKVHSALADFGEKT